MSTVTDALATVDYDHFVTQPDGSKLPQSSSITAIREMLEDLDVRPGDRVLEIGTGSGFTTGLLATLAGETGTVHSVEVLEDLVPRARDRLATAGITNAVVDSGDGYTGDPAHGPYDRVIAWATPHVIPAAWVDQLTTDAVVVAPVKIAPLATAHGIVAITVIDGRPTAAAVKPGGYIEMHPEPISVFGLPVRYVDASYLSDETEPWWLSSLALRDTLDTARHVLDALRTAPTSAPTPLTLSEDLSDLAAWLYATAPASLATAGLSDRFAAIGAADQDGAAFLTADELVTTAGRDDTAGLLTGWIEDWRAAGRPGWDDMTGTVTPTAEGWMVRLGLHSRR
ncbi:hypothetical protein GCM10027059_22510 [Myceligenerans halotolerans]